MSDTPVAQRVQAVHAAGDEYVHWLAEASPVVATLLGLPSGRSKIGDLSSDAFQRHLSSLESMRSHLAGIPLEGFPPEDRADASLLERNLASEHRRLAKTQDWLKNPALYLTLLLEGGLSLLRRADDLGAPLADLASRLGETKAVLAAARANAAQPARVHAETAVDLGKALSAWLSEIVAVAAAETEGGADAAAAARAAAGEVSAYVADLEASGFRDAIGVAATGDALYAELLEAELAEPSTSKGVLELAGRWVELVRGPLESAAAEADRLSSWPQTAAAILAEREAGEASFERARLTLLAARELVLRAGVASVPEDDRMVVGSTPTVLFPFASSGGYEAPGPFESDAAGRWLVSIPPSADSTIGVSPHEVSLRVAREAYPGTHLAILHGRRHPSAIRRLQNNAAARAGWAMYAESMMESLGFLADARVRVVALRGRLLAALRARAEVLFHCEGRPAPEIARLFVDEAGLSPPAALAEARGVAFSPGAAGAALLAHVSLLRLLRDARDAAGPGFRLRDFHDRYLACGSLPPALARTLLHVPSKPA